MTASIRHRRRNSGRRSTRLHIDRLAAPGGLALNAAGDAPHLLPPEPESARGAFVSGSITALLHLGAVGALVVLTWLAPEVIEEIIPVQIIKELPGSMLEPAPAPRALAPLAPAPFIAPAPIPQVAQPVLVDRVPAQALQMDRLDAAQAPTEITPQPIQSRRIEARTAVEAPRVAAVEVSRVDVAVTDLNAPVVDVSGPRAIAVGAQVDIAAPKAFAPLSAVRADTYTGNTVAGPSVTSLEAGATTAGIAIDTNVSEEFLHGSEGSGGTGTALGVVRCDESAFVQRYYALIKERTYARWKVPPDTPSNHRVTLRFQLDHSGSATSVGFVEASTPELGASAVNALRAASPFPAMDDNVRCVAGRSLLAKFSIPEGPGGNR